jgi:D-alanine-D-alanine ligase
MGDNKLRLALVFGGRSGEHEVSVVSAKSVDGALDRGRYEVVPMAIDRNGRWTDGETARRILEEAPDRTDAVKPFAGRYRLDPRLVEEDFDVAFPVLHGPYGEDGTIQGLFEMLDLPHVGCDAASSAVCMDKIFCKSLLRDAGIPTPEWHALDRAMWSTRSDEILASCLELGLPLFVKPARLGSSVGITKVAAKEQLEAAIDEALSHGHRALVERGVEAREIEIAVLGNDEPRPSIPGEIIPGHEFYDYEDKYVDSQCQLLAPASLDEQTTIDAQELAISAYEALGCSGMARVDLFVAPDGSRLWVNEVNTIPGFTSISMYPRLWGLTGLDYSTLLDELVRLARERSSPPA